jgi:hypothetical protein
MEVVGHECAAELPDGMDVALFVSERVQVTGLAFVEFVGLLKAGHATQRRCLGGLE